MRRSTGRGSSRPREPTPPLENYGDVPYRNANRYPFSNPIAPHTENDNPCSVVGHRLYEARTDDGAPQRNNHR